MRMRSLRTWLSRFVAENPYYSPDGRRIFELIYQSLTLRIDPLEDADKHFVALAGTRQQHSTLGGVNRKKTGASGPRLSACCDLLTRTPLAFAVGGDPKPFMGSGNDANG